jgi:hypothetical protein
MRICVGPRLRPLAVATACSCGSLQQRRLAGASACAVLVRQLQQLAFASLRFPRRCGGEYILYCILHMCIPYYGLTVLRTSH